MFSDFLINIEIAVGALGFYCIGIFIGDVVMIEIAVTAEPPVFHTDPLSNNEYRSNFSRFRRLYLQRVRSIGLGSMSIRWLSLIHSAYHRVPQTLGFNLVCRHIVSAILCPAPKNDSPFSLISSMLRPRYLILPSSYFSPGRRRTRSSSTLPEGIS